jgi:hypothetical protein
MTNGYQRIANHELCHTPLNGLKAHSDMTNGPSQFSCMLIELHESSMKLAALADAWGRSGELTAGAAAELLMLLCSTSADVMVGQRDSLTSAVVAYDMIGGARALPLQHECTSNHTTWVAISFSLTFAFHLYFYATEQSLSNRCLTADHKLCDQPEPLSLQHRLSPISSMNANVMKRLRFKRRFGRSVAPRLGLPSVSVDLC